MKKRPVIAVIGGKKEVKALMKEAEEAGRLIAEGGAILISGGLNGVMESASKGARSASGLRQSAYSPRTILSGLTDILTLL